jgi:hypothetical protein
MDKEDSKQYEVDNNYIDDIDESIFDKIKNIFKKKDTLALNSANETSHHKTTNMGTGTLMFTHRILNLASSLPEKIQNTISKLTSKSSDEIINKPGMIQTNTEPIVSKIIQPKIQPKEIVQAQIKAKSAEEQSNTISSPENNNVVIMAGTIHEQSENSNKIEATDINFDDTLKEKLESAESKELSEEEINKKQKQAKTSDLSVSTINISDKENKKEEKNGKEER